LVNEPPIIIRQDVGDASIAGGIARMSSPLGVGPCGCISRGRSSPRVTQLSLDGKDDSNEKNPWDGESNEDGVMWMRKATSDLRRGHAPPYPGGISGVFGVCSAYGSDCGAADDKPTIGGGTSECK
jgi:hypothetical protein